MINLIMTGSEKDLEELTGLDRDRLWDVGFNLDDWDVCFVSNEPLHSRIEVEHHENRVFDEQYDEEVCELDYDDPRYDDIHWLYWRMDNYCVGFNHVEYGGRHYYTVHHS